MSSLRIDPRTSVLAACLFAAASACAERTCSEAIGCAGEVMPPERPDLGPQCWSDADCAEPTICTGGWCRVRPCIDGVRDGDETDIDCGGSCAPCGEGGGCVTASDCASASCAAPDGGTSRCAPARCDDGVRNGVESDADCGGLDCPSCALGRLCRSGGDCAERVCGMTDGGEGRCAEPRCDDGVRNGVESDLDCGGPRCDPCVVGRACALDADCQSGICYGTLCRPVCPFGRANCDNINAGCNEVNTLSDPTNCGGCGRRCAMGGRCENGTCPAGVSYRFTSTTGDPQECVAWRTFRAALPMTVYRRITLLGINDPNVGVSCIGNNASALCAALRTAQNFVVFCDGRPWAVTVCGKDVEVSASAAGCQCEQAGYVIRPCEGPDRGGIKSATCGTPPGDVKIVCE